MTRDWLYRRIVYDGQMKTATLTEAKNRFAALVAQVRAGESITILDRGTPVARLEPVVARSGQVGRPERLERAGLARLGSSPPPIDLIRVDPPPLQVHADAVEVLLDERRLGR